LKPVHAAGTLSGMTEHRRLKPQTPLLGFAAPPARCAAARRGRFHDAALGDRPGERRAR
jgi:hypothetical protein